MLIRIIRYGKNVNEGRTEEFREIETLEYRMCDRDLKIDGKHVDVGYIDEHGGIEAIYILTPAGEYTIMQRF